jgi:hypothetical protein
MDNDKVVELLLDVKDRMVRVETKLDAYNGLNQKLDRLEGRLLKLEGAPGTKWNALTTSIITGIGGLIAGGIMAAIVSNMNK